MKESIRAVIAVDMGLLKRGVFTKKHVEDKLHRLKAEAKITPEELSGALVFLLSINP